MSPIGSTGLTAFSLSGPSEAAQLGRFNSLVQQNTAQLAANGQRNADLSQAAGATKPPSFTAQPLAPASFAPPPRTFAAPLPAPRPLPAFTSQPLAGGFTPPPPASTTAALSPDALASPVTSPAINTPVVSDPCALVDRGGVGLSPNGPAGPIAFAVAPGMDAASTAAVPPPAKPISPDGVTIPGADPALVDAPVQELGFLPRVGTRIAENFSKAFEAPLGLGPGYDEITRPTGYGVVDGFNQPLFRAFDGILSAGDAVSRTFAAGYNSLIDTGIEGLASSGLMSNGSAERLGRDIKAMLELCPFT